MLLPTALLTLASLGLASPVAQRDTPKGCTNASFSDFAWTLEGFEFHASYIFTTPAHQNSWGYVSFNLSNPAVPDVKAVCSATSNQLNHFFYGNLWYTCTTAGGEGEGEEHGNGEGVGTTFAFDRAGGRLEFNQTWSCEDQDPRYPTTFSGYASVDLTLDCTDSTWENANWTMGQIYSDREVKCAPVTVPVQQYTMTAVA